MNLRFLYLLALTWWPAVSVLAQADESEPANPNTRSPLQLGIVLGYGQQENPYISGDDEEFYALLDISYYGSYAFFDNGDIGAYLYTNESSTVNFIVTSKNERSIFEPVSHLTRGLKISGTSSGLNSDISFTDGGNTPDREVEQEPLEMETIIPARETSIDAGFEYIYESHWGTWQSQYTKDISSTHNGYEFWLSYSYQHALAKGTFSYSLGLSQKSKEYVDYYYGISAEESNPLLSEYQGESSTNWVVKLGYGRSFTEKISFSGFVVHEKLAKAIQQSPVVDKQSINTVFIGLYYRFY